MKAQRVAAVVTALSLVFAACSDSPGTTTTRASASAVVTTQVATPESDDVDVFVFDDPPDDCHVPFFDDPATCFDGAIDIRTYTIEVSRTGVGIEIQLASDPMVSELNKWFFEFVVETDANGFGCGVSNVDFETEQPSSDLDSYVFDYVGTAALDHECKVQFINEPGTYYLRLDYVNLDGSFDAETFISGGTFGSDADGSTGSADDLFNGLPFADEFDFFVTVGDLCDAGAECDF